MDAGSTKIYLKAWTRVFTLRDRSKHTTISQVVHDRLGSVVTGYSPVFSSDRCRASRWQQGFPAAATAVVAVPDRHGRASVQQKTHMAGDIRESAADGRSGPSTCTQSARSQRKTQCGGASALMNNQVRRPMSSR